VLLDDQIKMLSRGQQHHGLLSSGRPAAAYAMHSSSLGLQIVLAAAAVAHLLLAALAHDPMGSDGHPAVLPALQELPVDRVTRLSPAGSTSCADGSAFSFLVRRGSPVNERKIIVDFMGGGACWDEHCLTEASRRFQRLPDTLSFVDGLASEIAGSVLLGAGLSAFPLDSRNPLGDTRSYTYVFVPYCTQDIHLGTCSQTYTDPQSGESRTLLHNGEANTRAVMSWVYSNFSPSTPAAPHLLAFVGCSAGAAGVIIAEAARASQAYAADTVRIVAIGDSPCEC
jgi:hypothetical protein